MATISRVINPETDGKAYKPEYAQKRAAYEERINSFVSSFVRYTAGRVDALFLKIPAQMLVGALQSAKILLKATVCVLTCNQCKHIDKFWSFSGIENDVGILAGFVISVGFTVKDVILAPSAKYSLSGATLFKGVRLVFGGSYHDSYENCQVESKLKQSIIAAWKANSE